MIVDILKVCLWGLGILFAVYTIPRLITFAICISYYEAKIKFFEIMIKKVRLPNETK
jgi:hypothetical protein